MDGTKLRYGFLNNHHVLVKRLSTPSLVPHLYSASLISLNEKSLIHNQPADGLKTDLLLDILHRQGVSNPQVYVDFFTLLSDESVSSGQNLGDVLKKIKKDALSEEVAKKFDYRKRLLEEDDHASLMRHKWAIVQSLSVQELLPELISYGVISTSDKEEIQSEATPNEQALKLCSIIEDRGSRAYNDFVTVLLDSDRHKHLGERLQGTETHVVSRSSSGVPYLYPVEEALKRGHVPPRQGVYVERKDMILKIRNVLRELQDHQEGWVLVHGIAGFGKTVLAAEAVRDEEILGLYPGGVHWLTVGKLSDHQGDIDRAKILSKLQTLILRLDKSNTNRQLPSVEAAKDYLQKVIQDQYPKSLLILDDVWSHEVVNAFSVRCRILVTSRVAALISPVLVKNVHSVSVSEGFTEEESKQLLAQWLGKETHELPPQYSEQIIKYCRGSPMAIGLIGAMLRKNSSERKWKAIAEKMEKKHLIMSAGMSNRDHHTLKASIELSVDSLPEEQREYFEMLTVFDYDIAIPLKVLEIIWNVDDEFDAEEHMNVIMDYSLAQRSITVDEDCVPFYTIHDIIMDYLKESISPERQRKLHQLVVERYEERCDGAFSKLEDDHYIFRKLIGHIIAAGDYELLGSLLSQLRWLVSNVVYGDANMLLAHYKDYKSKVPQSFQADVQKFELFLSGHMFVLANNPKKDDILQLALLQPEDSEVYMQALTIAKDKRKKSWFKWSNKESDPEKYALKLKLHNEGVTSCQFSEDGEMVLSCAGTEVKLWDSSTGMVMGNFKGHTDRVTCCALSGNGRLLISSSEDCTVKVWESRSCRLVCDFREHSYGVQCCSLSPDNRWVISADIDSVIILWEPLLGKVQKRWRLGILSPSLTPTVEYANVPPDFSCHRSSSGGSQESTGGASEGVLACNFSPDGTKFVTSSQNGLIRLWDLSSFCVSLTFHGHCTQVKCCVFSKTGSQIASASYDHTARVLDTVFQDCTAALTHDEVWDTSSGDCTATLTHDDEVAVLSCDFSQDASRVITGDTNGSVRVWSLPHGLLLQDLPLHWDYVTCVLYAPNTQHILSAADNGIIKILWNEDVEAEGDHFSSAVQYHRRFSTHFLKEGSTYEPMVLCYVQKGNKLQIVKGSKAETVNDSLPTVAGANPRSWFFSNNGEMVVVGYVQGMMQLIKIKQVSDTKWSASEVWKAEHCHSKEVLKCFFSPDDTKIVSCSLKEHKVWSVSTGQLMASISGRGIGVKPCIFLADSIHIVCIQEGNVLQWDSRDGTSLVTYDYGSKEDTILCISISKSESRVVASATSGLVIVWKITGEVLMKSVVMPLSPCARSCDLSPDGSLAVAGFDDGSLKIWQVASGRELMHQYTGSLYWMIDVVFSPDGSRIVSLCDTIAWWKSDGTYVKRVLLKGTFGKYIRFSPDFQTFVTIDNAGLLYILRSLT